MVFTAIGTATLVQTFTFPNGSALVPSVTFTSNTNTGLFNANGNVGMTCGGVESAQITQQGMTIQGNLTSNVLVANAGTSTAPSVTFLGNSSVGLYSSSNLVTSSTNIQTPFGIALAMNTSTTLGGHGVLVHPMQCTAHNASSAGVSTGLVTPGAIGSGQANDFPGFQINNTQYQFWRTYVNMVGGTYRVRLHTSKNTDRGIVSIIINGTTVGTVDLYATGADYLYEVDTAAITTSGTYKVELQVNSKNASSSSYFFIFKSLGIVRIA